jgi:hypothetical protein
VRREDLDGLAMIDCCFGVADVPRDLDKAQAQDGKTDAPGDQARKENSE